MMGKAPAPADRNPLDSPAALWGPLLLAVALGSLAGVGGYTFKYARGFSYFSTDPKACVNCHIMQREYDGWQKASHHTSAVCIDCHLPHEFIPKYLAKAENGWRHGKMFTLQNFEEPIEVKPRGLEILQANCIRCHEGLTEQMKQGSSHAPSSAREEEAPSCLHCHSTVGHGTRAGLGGPPRLSELHEASPFPSNLQRTKP